MANWSSSSNSGMDQCSIYQLSDEISYSNQTPATPHVLANAHHYKHDILQPSHHQAATTAALRFQSQQIQNTNYHILSRHYLTQQQQQQQQQYHHYQHHQHSSRQLVNVSSSMPLNASKLICYDEGKKIKNT